MKAFLKEHWSRRYGFDGWAVTINGVTLDWTVSTTREEAREIARELKQELEGGEDMPLFKNSYQVAKVRLRVEKI